jgi:hypothetical protein
MNQSTEPETTTWPVHSKSQSINSSAAQTSVLIIRTPVEVRVSPKRTVRVDTIKKHVHSYLTSSFDRITVPSTVVGWENLPVLGDYVQRIVACESACPSQSLSLEEVSLQIHVYQPCESETPEEFANGPRRGDEEEVMSATMCELPNLGMEGLWESLIYADNIKLKLLDYIYATLILSDANIDCAECRFLLESVLITSISKSRVLEPGRASPRTPWNRQNFSMSCPRSETRNSPLGQVRTDLMN